MNLAERPSRAAMTRRIRLHRREWRHDGRTYQVIALRAGDPVRYAALVDEYGVLVTSDLAGTRLLGRLLWGLSYQRRPDTLLVLDPVHLVPNPQDGRPSPVLVFGVAGRTVLRPAAARRLAARRWWRSRPTSTVTWNTASFPAAMAEMHSWEDDRRAGRRFFGGPPPPDAILRASSTLVTVLADPQLLRGWSTSIGGAGSYWSHGESCTEPDWQTGFDVHAVRHFHRRVSAARRARAEVLAAPDCPTDPGIIDERVRAHVDIVAARRPGPWAEA